VRPVYTIVATVGIIFAALYVLLWYQRTMHGPPRGVLLEELPARPGTSPVPTGGHGGATSSGTATAVLAEPATAARARLRIRDLDRRELAVVTPLVALIIALGVYPQPLVDLVRPAVAATVSDVGGPAHGVTPVHPTSSQTSQTTDGGK
jgi:NADH-quinone oxidoreductase subunit M